MGKKAVHQASQGSEMSETQGGQRRSEDSQLLSYRPHLQLQVPAEFSARWEGSEGPASQARERLDECGSFLPELG